jgi:hypothetical protein
MPPFRRHIQERPEHKRPFFDPWMRQDKGSGARPRKAGTPSAPMPHEPLVIENVDIEGAWAPRTAPPAAGSPLDLLQEPQQRLRRQVRVDQGGGVDVRGLARATDRRSLIQM